MIMNIFYNVFIFPIEQIISVFFVIAYRIFENNSRLAYGLSLMGVSLVFSIITLPLYFLAEKYQHAERDIQARMKPDIDAIKSVFFGNERFMRLAVYYRHNGYHPIFALRSSISLLIQVPFFIAAYHFISNLEVIKGVSFGPISDLGRPDGLLSINNFSINVLPVIMTIINFASGTVYTKGFSKKDKIQLYGMALVFLVLLFNSPSGIALYWTCNNMFSLVKNIISKSKHSERILLILASAICFSLSIYIFFFTLKDPLKRNIIALFLFAIPFGIFYFQRLAKKKKSTVQAEDHTNRYGTFNIFLLSIIAIFLLTGLVIPTSLIASSAQEFSFIENHTNPIYFIVIVLTQTFGLFILLPICIYFLLAKNAKVIFAKIMFVLAGIFMANVFIFPGDYGSITVLFTFFRSLVSELPVVILNLLTIAAITVVFLLTYRFKKIISSVLAIFVCTFIVMGAVNCYNIFEEFNIYKIQLQDEKERASDYQNVYKLSRNGKNVVVILLDRGLNGYIPYIFDERPDLFESFDGFTWYRNTVTFGGSTIFGTLGLYGGYEYTPWEVQSRDKVPLVKKHNEALLLMPRLFLDKGFEVIVTDPPYANYGGVSDLSIFDDYPGIEASNIIGKYTQQWLSREGNQLDLISITEVIDKCLIRFSIFKCAPMLLRDFIYDYGRWFYIGHSKFPLFTLDNYASLDILKEITEIDDSDINTFNSIYNDLSHEPHFFSYPDYTPSNNIEDRGNGPFADEEHYHVNMASMLVLGKWFDFLKSQNVYDNTRIIVVSDHGFHVPNTFPPPDDIILPNGELIQSYATLLMMKDFYSHGKLLTDNTFMTNADVPLMATQDIVTDPVNPWTGKPITADKANGVTITTSWINNVQKHTKMTFDIKPNEWLHVRDNIYDLKNWSWVKR